jgi:hypothetical protein
MDFLELFNAVAKAVRPAYQDYAPVTDLDMPMTETGLDSMDSLMMGIFFCDIYGISEEVGKLMTPTTPREFKDFLEANKTKTPEGTVEELIKGVGW